ncbi:hypothetical protein [Nocardia huaxiensis]|uniref:Uncharacterized protein n=1 Tax=Nocardia huaxiensis TaxID=2755382 RepID=A0A7D6VCY5_9NOCA|nr:hypothetical protein [Nocardia huaxiensis]QLY33501.1 hypothetical protein H0264_15840 [Nocardia huaxiensis]UFS99579.1 hypothetical protein LPY97_17675 [Nocardia huaxiensis]
MSIPEQAVLSLVVVLDEVEGRLVVWHVNVGQPIGLSRLSGAWVLEPGEGEAVAMLAAGQRIVVRGGGSEVPGGIAVAGVVDVDATVAAAQAEVEAVDGLFSSHQEAVAGKLIRPQWPEMTHPEDGRQEFPAADEIVRPALALAHGIADLADAWADFESLRVARSFLTARGGRTARALPLVVR